jgi:hypothetical protein
VAATPGWGCGSGVAGAVTGAGVVGTGLAAFGAAGAALVTTG